MKKKLLITLGIVFILFGILFIIQLVDENINGDDYRKIHKFGQEINSVIKNDTACVEDLDNILKSIIDDTYSDEKSNLIQINLNQKINACYALSKKISQISVPQIHNQRKNKLMNLSKEEFANSFSNMANIIKIYNSCEQKNSSCINGYDILFLNDIMEIHSKLVVNSIDIYLTYSIKDILITRPFLIYLKQNLKQ